MKKLLFLIGCITALTCMNSCTADSIEDSKTSKTIKQPVITVDDIGDKDTPKP